MICAQKTERFSCANTRFDEIVLKRLKYVLN